MSGNLAPSLKPRRHLDLDGAWEVRDTGGYATVDGGRTRWQTFLRSTNLDQLTAESQQALIDYGVRTVVDLRRASELERRPDVFARSRQVTYHHHEMVDDDFRGEAARDISDRGLGPYIGRWSHETTLHILGPRRAQICATLATLAGPAGFPAIVHCSAGKGRTGLIVALVLSLAGVPAETIADDYALTGVSRWRRRGRQRPSSWSVDRNETWEEYLQSCCPRSAMFKTLQLLEDRYGGIERYVKDGGLTDEQILRIQTAVVE